MAQNRSTYKPLGSKAVARSSLVPACKAWHPCTDVAAPAISAPRRATAHMCTSCDCPCVRCASCCWRCFGNRFCALRVVPAEPEASMAQQSASGGADAAQAHINAGTAAANVACCNAVGCGRAVSNRPGAHGAGLATTASLSILIRILVAQGCCSRGAGTCTACRSLGAVAGSQSAFPPITIAAARAKRSAPRPDTPAYVMLCVLAARWRTRAQGAFHVRAAGRARRRAHGKDP